LASGQRRTGADELDVAVAGDALDLDDGVLGGDRLRLVPWRAVAEDLQVDLAAARVDAGRDHLAGPRLLGRQRTGERLQRADADRRDLERQRQPLGEGQAHAQAGERSRPGGDPDAVELVEADLGLGHHLRDQHGQPLLVAFDHGLGARGQHPPAREDGGRTGRKRSVDGEDDHGAWVR
jgi:hypothetical protein